MDSLSSLTHGVSLSLSLSTYCFDSISLTLSALLLLLFQRQKAEFFLLATLALGIAESVS